MRKEEILACSAVELSGRIKAGEIKVAEAVDAVLKVIEEKEDFLHCYVTIEREKLMAQAEEVQKKIDAGELTGPLAGVPFAIKDNLCT